MCCEEGNTVSREEHMGKWRMEQIALVWELRKSLSQEVIFELMVRWQGVFSYVTSIEY